MLFNIKALAVIAVLANLVVAAPVAESAPDTSSPDADATLDKRLSAYSVWQVNSGGALHGYTMFRDGDVCRNRGQELFEKNYGYLNRAFTLSPDKPLRFDNVAGLGTVEFWLTPNGSLAGKRPGQSRSSDWGVASCRPASGDKVGESVCKGLGGSEDRRKWLCVVT
ncbi:uncharacterized protein LOC62_03G004650 [Vanrija pseudolonga]|uniref:Lipocalin-like domain-containing protein n=1 Tax=Vanrija pseudolonga TaxID=143232 RepID=A0AAF1BLP1_9TREE|nr:hypothetical protein LOC62_03G004650 [Vanrija pseudolonga]